MRKPHINIADLLFLSAQGGTEFNSLLAVWCSLFSSRWEDKLNVAQANSILEILYLILDLYMIYILMPTRGFFF